MFLTYFTQNTSVKAMNYGLYPSTLYPGQGHGQGKILVHKKFDLVGVSIWIETCQYSEHYFSAL